MSVQDLRNRILGFKAEIPTTEVEGIGTIGCKTLGAGEFIALRDYIRLEETSDLDAMVRTLIVCACEPEEATTLFSDADAAGLAANVPFTVLQDVTHWMGNVQIGKAEDREGNLPTA